MEKNIFDALPGFDRLLEQKTFEELSGQERDQVLQFITEEEYTLFREAVIGAQQRRISGDHRITPDPLVIKRLMQTFRSAGIPPSVTVPGTFSRFFRYRIPLYQAGLAASVLLFLVFYLFLQNYRLPENQLYASQMRDAMSRMSVISGLDKDKSVTHDAGLMKLVVAARLDESVRVSRRMH